MVNARNNSKPVLYSKLDVSKIEFTQMDTKSKEQNRRQFTSWIRYGNGNLVFQTPEIQLTSHGIPPKEGKDGSEWFKDDLERSYIKLPLDENQNRVSTFKNLLNNFDEHARNNLKTIFGSEKSAKKYHYNHVVKTPQSNAEVNDDDEDEEEENSNNDEKVKIPKPDYIKVKLDLNWETKKCVTPVFVKNESGKPERVKVDCISDLEKFVGYKSKIICVIMANKVWASKTADMTGARQCGITFKLIQISIDNSDRQSSGARQDFTEYAIINENEDNDDDDNEEAEKAEEAEEVEEAEEAEEEEDEEEAEEEEEEVDDEDEEEEEEVDDDEDEDEEEEEEEEVVVTKKKTKSSNGTNKKSAKSKSKSK